MKEESYFIKDNSTGRYWTVENTTATNFHLEYRELGRDYQKFQFISTGDGYYIARLDTGTIFVKRRKNFKN